MKKKTIGKLALLLVVLGWFCPISCGQTGPEWCVDLFSGDTEGMLTICAICLILSMLAALVGLLLFFTSSIKKEENKDKIASTVLSMCLGAPFIVLTGMTTFDGESFLNYGSFIMIAGWVLSLIFLILGKKGESSEPNSQIK